jgi:DNA ligase (NAD+)
MAVVESSVEERIKFLRSEIDRHDRLYYVEARPVIGDRDYDLLYEELLKLERENPQFFDLNSPTQRVSGESISAFKQVIHDPPMQSLDKTHSRGELEDFDSFLRKEISSFSYCVEPKVDGVSISLYYENRRFVRAATRGNGKVGDDVTQNVKTIRSVPLTLPESAPDNLEVRGEIYMTRDGFVKLNESEIAAGREPFANPRNAAAGSLKQLSAAETAKRPLDIVVYNAGSKGCDGFSSHVEMIEAFASWGFPVSPWIKVCPNMTEAFSAIEKLGAMRHDFRFEIDGAVIKVNERQYHSLLGATAHGPRWARAFKYAPERAETVIEGITVQVGRTGIITPVAELKPVELAGSVISRATLHNADQIERQDIRIGDSVWIVKAGDVIPAVESVIVDKRTGSELKFEMPDICPVCGGKLGKIEGEVAIRCFNPSCKAQLQRRLEHFAGRNALDITNLGGRVADILVDKGLVRDVLDIFELDYSSLSELDVGDETSPRKFGKNAEAMRQGVEKAKTLPLDRWLFAIGISNVGTTVARDIALEHEDMKSLSGSDVLKNVLENDLKKGKDRKILPIKVEAAKAVLAFFDSEYGKRFLDRLEALGINPSREKPAQSLTGMKLNGVTFVMTGSLSLPRDEYAALIRKEGGTVQSSVTSKTMYLVAGENTGASKTEKARALGTKVIDENELKQMLGMAGDETQEADKQAQSEVTKINKIEQLEIF